MNHTVRSGRFGELLLIVLSGAAVVSVLLSNVIRVLISPEVAFNARASLFVLSWIAAIGWGIASKEFRVLRWLAVIAGAGLLLATCQAFSGGISVRVLAQVLGPAGAGVGAALLVKRLIQTGNGAWLAATAGMFGCAAAIWLALEPSCELWKLLPNSWEVSKNLEYRWGIRMGQDRARFLFDTPMEAGVAQWFCGVMSLVGLVDSNSRPVTRTIFGVVVLALFGSIALTYSRAGMVLAALSLGVALLTRIRSRRATITTGLVACAIMLLVGIIAGRTTSTSRPLVKNVASILDPAEEANQTRISQFARMGSDLVKTPWHGWGAASFVTFSDAPRMPNHESSPVNLISAFGLGGVALVAAFIWAYARQWRRFAEVVLEKPFPRKETFSHVVAVIAPPYAVYSLVSPIFAGLVFGMICFTIMGLLVVWDTPLTGHSGKL